MYVDVIPVSKKYWLTTDILNIELKKIKLTPYYPLHSVFSDDINIILFV